MERALCADGRALHSMPGVYLSDFDEIRKTNGDPFRIYSPFARAAKAAAWDDPLPAPSRVRVPDNLSPDGQATIDGPWSSEGARAGQALHSPTPDPVAALERPHWFVERRVDRYGTSRNLMAVDGTSRLSPSLRFGLLSPRQVAAAVGRFEFEDDPEGLAAWREGRTGYPLVDAGMRQAHRPSSPPGGPTHRPGRGRCPPRHRLPSPHRRPHHRPGPCPRPVPGVHLPPFVTHSDAVDHSDALTRLSTISPDLVDWFRPRS